MTAAARLDLTGLTGELAAHAGEVDRTRRAPAEGLAALGRRGLLGALIPRVYGGLELSPAELFEVAAAIGAGCGATGLIWGQHLASSAFIARWGNDAARALLPEAVDGRRLFGIGVGYTSLPDGPVQARRENGRILISGEATWVTGASLLTDGLISAQDATTGGVLMAVVTAAELAAGPPYGMVAVTSGMNCTVTLRDVDVTDRLLSAPLDRSQTSAVFTQNKAPRDAGFYTGLSRACLALAAQARTLDAAGRDRLDAITGEVEEAAAAMRRWLEPHTYEHIDAQAFWQRYDRLARLMWQAAGLVMSAGGSGGLLDGAEHNRLAREAMYYLARINIARWLARD